MKEWKNYNDYLQSPEWKQKRQEALARAEGRCQLCNSNKNLEVHHRKYSLWGTEPVTDLTVLCSSCHYQFEKQKRRKEKPHQKQTTKHAKKLKRRRERRFLRRQGKDPNKVAPEKYAEIVIKKATKELHAALYAYGKTNLESVKKLMEKKIQHHEGVIKRVKDAAFNKAAWMNTEPPVS